MRLIEAKDGAEIKCTRRTGRGDLPPVVDLVPWRPRPARVQQPTHYLRWSSLASLPVTSNITPSPHSTNTLRPPICSTLPPTFDAPRLCLTPAARKTLRLRLNRTPASPFSSYSTLHALWGRPALVIRLARAGSTGLSQREAPGALPPSANRSRLQCRLDATSKSISAGLLPKLSPGTVLSRPAPRMRTLPPQSGPLLTFLPQVLLVPTTEILLNSRDRETNAHYTDLAGSEEFLASHVLRLPGGVPPGPNGKEASFRESRGKAKQYQTANGRTVIIKDTFLYSNKGR